MRVRDHMLIPVLMIGPEASLSDAAHLMARNRVRHLAVVWGGRLVGLLTERDLDAARPSPATSLTVTEIAGHLEQIRVDEVMRREVPTVAPGAGLAEAARVMRDFQLSAVPVLRDEALVGLLTEASVLGALARLPGAPTTHASES
jgi:acetoin utilization protein AcuB